MLSYYAYQIINSISGISDRSSFHTRNHTLIPNPCYSASFPLFFHSNFEHKKKPEKPEFRQFVGCKMLIFVKNRNFSDKDIL